MIRALQLQWNVNKSIRVGHESKCMCYIIKQCHSFKALPDAYQPRLVEAGKWQKLSSTLENGYEAKGKNFRMILPPPNITGNLHLGHALMAIVQDVICRHKQQMGYEVEWIPGTDHAGIATQLMIEKKLLAEQKCSRKDMSREDLLKYAWSWKQEKSEAIMKDLEKLGCLLAWDKEYFTMNERISYAVNEAFIKLFDAGLIKREESLINWSCTLETVISDIEVEMLELKGPTELSVPGYKNKVVFGYIYDIKYKILNNGQDDEYITVSTTRPETILGDVAVAVHPADVRYLKYRSMPEIHLWHPFRKETIPLIFDFAVDPKIGTGAVKLTPAHNRNDWQIARKHILKPIPVFTTNGSILDDYESFARQPRFLAREAILQKLAELNLLASIRGHAMQLPICSRSRDIVEYMVREQWFLKCKMMARAALSEVLSGRLKIIPTSYEIEWKTWLEDCHDWCISRQLWWGHQIPVYKVECSRKPEQYIWIAGHNEAEVLEKIQTRWLTTQDIHITRDPDVLDTWFSSALLPLSVFGWPTKKYKEHYPLELIETGHDILFFWVARMVMLGLQLTNQSPFKKILLSGIICDVHGRKMSKSLGNIITPQQVVKGVTLKALQDNVRQAHNTGIFNSQEMEKSLKGLKSMFPQGILECGTDALRFTLCNHNIKNRFINFDVKECYSNKLFLNKIWQAMRYTLAAAKRLKMPIKDIEFMPDASFSKWDLWILSRLADTLYIYQRSFGNYNLHIATATLKQFFYGNLCDVYIEITKNNISTGNNSGCIHCSTLVTCLILALQAMKPFTPFICTELLERLPRNIKIDLNHYHNIELMQEISQILDICQNIRQLKSQQQISKKHDPHIRLYTNSLEKFELLQPYLREIQALTFTTSVDINMMDANNKVQEHSEYFSTASHLCSFDIIVKDKDNTKDGDKSITFMLNRKKLEKLERELLRYRSRLHNEGFRKSASPKIQQQHVEKVQKLQMEIAAIKSI